MTQDTTDKQGIQATRILIVEDESLISFDYRLQLERSGFEVIATVRNASDAEAIIEREKPDVILMDIHIKGPKNGLELAKEIHSHDSIPILFITASTRPDIISEIEMLTGCRMIAKPVNPEIIEETIRDMRLAG